MNASNRSLARRGFSLIELVIVVVIIGIIAAIAIPRMSKGASGAADSALTANLAVLRNAIDLFQTEHQVYPTGSKISDQLTKFTDNTQQTSDDKTGGFVFGPYLRSVPPLPVGAKKGSVGIAGAAAAGIGWVYTESNGKIKAGSADAEVDSRGVAYNTY
jgi:general secretion pathway protein G